MGSAPVGPAIYVATSGVDTAPGTSPATPLKTIQAGLDAAAKCPGAPCSVLVAAGTYLQALQLRDGVSLYGQYAADFSARAGSSVVTIASGDIQTIVANGLTKPTTIDGVTIQGGALTTSDGSSTYTVWVHGSGSALFLSNSEIFGGKAAAGAPGADGGRPRVPIDRRRRRDGSTIATRTRAARAPRRAIRVTAGDGGGGGSNNCPSACPLVGSDGISDGTAGSAGRERRGRRGRRRGVERLRHLQRRALWGGALGGAGARGMHGTGGGGGGSGGTKKFVACFGCGTLVGGNGAAGGNGGCGGGGGGPGGSGGGSFGLVTDSSVTLENVTVIGGFGGAGGAGGAGATGTLGGASDAGRAGSGGLAEVRPHQLFVRCGRTRRPRRSRWKRRRRRGWRGGPLDRRRDDGRGPDHAVPRDRDPRDARLGRRGGSGRRRRRSRSDGRARYVARVLTCARETSLAWRGARRVESELRPSAARARPGCGRAALRIADDRH